LAVRPDEPELEPDDVLVPEPDELAGVDVPPELGAR
jgi:hypothetical protein